MNPLLTTFIPVAKAIAKMFGEDCEVILHDVRDLEHSVVMIENGHVTGRKIGSSMTDLGLYFLQSDIFKDTDFVANYHTESEDGKKLKSTSIFIRNEKREIIGYLCINYALGDLLEVNKKISNFCSVNKNVDHIGPDEEKDETFTETLDELFSKMFGKALKEVGKPLGKMQKEDKVRVVRYLYKRGVFLVSRTIEVVADRLNVSRYTIYNYLAEIKKEKEKKVI